MDPGRRRVRTATYEMTGEVPSLRTVGQRAEMPHSTVAKALDRFAGYIGDVGRP